MFELLVKVRREVEAAAASFDATALVGDEAARAVDCLGAIRRLTDGMLARAALRVAETNAHLAHGDRNAAQFFARTTGLGAGEGRTAMETAAALDALPATDAAVREGRLSARQAGMIAGAAAHDPSMETALLDAASHGTTALRDACLEVSVRSEDPAARSLRQHGARLFRMWTAADGMIEGRFRLTPETGGGLKAVVDLETRRRFRAARAAGRAESHDALAADALVALVCGVASSAAAGAGADAGSSVGTGAGSRAVGVAPSSHMVHVVVDHALLVRGNLLGGERCEIPGVGPVNVGWVRELLGSAFVAAVVRKGRDITTVAHFGRHIPAELRTAMIASGRECEVHGCHARDYLELDHCVVDHAQGGPTARWNLAWLCSVHHRRKSKGWRLGPADPVSGKRSLEPPDGAAEAA